MKAIVRDTYGSADVLRLEDIEPPTIAADEVLIRVGASSINAGDKLVMQGVPYLMRLMTGLRRPKTRGLGQDVAGTIEAVGAGVTEWSVGDEVFGEVTFGETWAELAVAKANVLGRKPPSLSFEEAASLPLAAITALCAVRDHGKIKPGQRVLVNGGSGSVGSYVVQMAKAHGAEVTAVCSTRHHERARELGAAHVIDYATQDYVASGQTWDLILDVAGTRTLAENRTVLAPRGAYIAIGGPVDESLLGPMPRLAYLALANLFTKQRIVVFVSDPSRDNLDALTEMIATGTLVPAFEERCTLAQIPERMRAVESGEVRGKVVVTVS